MIEFVSTRDQKHSPDQKVDWTKPHSNCILTIVHVKRNQEKHGENVYDNVVSYGHKPLVPQQHRSEAY